MSDIQELLNKNCWTEKYFLIIASFQWIKSYAVINVFKDLKNNSYEDWEDALMLFKMSTN